MMRREYGSDGCGGSGDSFRSGDCIDIACHVFCVSRFSFSLFLNPVDFVFKFYLFT